MANKKPLTPVDFLAQNGILMTNVALICHIEGCMRQPDLVKLMDDYHKAKLDEMVKVLETPEKIK